MYIGEPFEVDDANPKIIIRRRHDEPHPSEHLASSLTYTTQLEKKEGNGYRTLFSSPDYDVMGTGLMTLKSNWTEVRIV